MFATLHAGIGVKQTHSYARSLILCRWGQGIEVMADKYNLSTSGGIRLVTFLDADVIVRQPSAFAVGTILK